MKIAIEARALSMRGGVATYTARLLDALSKLQLSDDVTVITDSEQTVPAPFHTRVAHLRNAFLLPWWMNSALPKAVQSIAPDVIHFTKAAVPAKRVGPTVVTIHDVIPLFLPQTQSVLRRWWWPRALGRAIEQSDHILTSSEVNKRDIMRFFDIDPSKITATPLAADLNTFRSDISSSEIDRVKKLHAISAPYILFVGTRDVRKNIQGLISAFIEIAPHIPHQLVIAGRVADKADKSERLASSSAFADRIKFLDFISFEDLPALYAGADLFVWPSIYEGWGFPPQEAMASGVPVIVSDGGSLPEVVGSAGEVVSFSSDNPLERLHDVDFIKRLAQRMESVLASSSTREEMKHKGLQQVQKFSWDDVAKKTYEVYKKVAL